MGFNLSLIASTNQITNVRTKCNPVYKIQHIFLNLRILLKV